MSEKHLSKSTQQLHCKQIMHGAGEHLTLPKFVNGIAKFDILES